MAVRHLIAHRHRRIACVGLGPRLWTIKQRMEGYCDEMAVAGLRPDLCTLGESPEEMLQAVQSLLARSRPPTALFCTNNLITRNALHSLSALNVAIPQQMAVVGFDDFDMADIIKPAVTVVRQPVEALGRTAAELLFERLSSSNAYKEPRRIILPLELVMRDSCGGHPKLDRRRRSVATDYAVA
jgi:LacI family transcriptional regulator